VKHSGTEKGRGKEMEWEGHASWQNRIGHRGSTGGEGLLPRKALLALGCVVSRLGWMDSSDHWHWSRPHLPGPRTKATRLRPQGYCPGFL